jgi:CBS-domain-containing membrane protein
MKLWRVDDVMTTDVVTVREDTLCHEIVDLLVRHRIGAVPVVDDEGHAIGVVSATDLLPGPVAAPSGRYRHVRLRGFATVARDVMSRPAVVAQPSLAVDFAARLMRRAKVHRLVVVDRRGRVAGIVTRRDLLRTRLAGEGPHQPGPSALPARRTADLV